VEAYLVNNPFFDGGSQNEMKKMETKFNEKKKHKQLNW